MNLVGIAGHPGAGKDLLGEFLAIEWKNLGARCVLVSTGDLIREYIFEHKLGERGDRTVTRKISAELRSKLGPDFLAKLAWQQANEHGAEAMVVSGLRHTAEVDFLRQHNGFLIAIDVPTRVRYERVQARARHGNQISFEMFLDQEAAESAGESHHVGEVAKLADVTVVNDGSLDQLKLVAKRILVDLDLEKIKAGQRTGLHYIASEN